MTYHRKIDGTMKLCELGFERDEILVFVVRFVLGLVLEKRLDVIWVWANMISHGRVSFGYIG